MQEQETTDQVWNFMLEYQASNHGMPPTMDEICGAIPELNYRSSVKYVQEQLVEEGRAEVMRAPGTSHRVRAIPKEGATIATSPTPPPGLWDDSITTSVPAPLFPEERR